MSKARAQTYKRWIVIDLLRIAAMLFILIGHISYWRGWQINRDVADIFSIYDVVLADIGVSMFLILSGLVLELKYGSKRIEYLRFVKRRLLGIYPVYFVSLGFSVPIFIFIKLFSSGGGYLPYSDLNFISVFCSIFGICPYFGLWGGPFLATGWFIGLILALYLLFPLISREMNRGREIMLLGLLAVSISTRLLLINGVVHLETSPLDWFPLARLFEFGLGIYLGKKTGL